jgi:hypothetical protein
MMIDQNLIEFVICCLVGDQEAFQYARVVLYTVVKDHGQMVISQSGTGQRCHSSKESKL